MYKLFNSFFIFLYLNLAANGAPPREDNQEENFFKHYITIGLAGAARGLAGLPLEHPFDCVKTRLQAQPETLSALQAAKNIYSEKGMRGFFAGVLPNGTRMAIKQFYRYPMMLWFPNFYNNHLPPEWEKERPWVKKALTGGTIASLEAGIINPLERLKVLLMTSPTNQTLGQFFSTSKNNVTSELYKGFGATYPKQLLSWVSFLVADEQIKNGLRHLKNNSSTKHYKDIELSYAELLLAGIGVGIVNTSVTLPWDCVKTHLQKREPLECKGVIDGMQKIVKSHGLRGLYAGWQVRLLHYTLHSIFTVSVLEKLERAHSKK